jgi:acyl-coenzyme A synthetase/AMP-(fatty) acid ligase
LLDASLFVAADLDALGLRWGDVVVAQMPHLAEGVQLLLAALRIGLIFVPVAHIYGPAELEFILDQTKARALVLLDPWRNIDHAERVATLGDMSQLEHLVVVGDGAMARPSTCWSDIAGGRHGSAPRTPGESDNIAAINFTSGTTLAPKGVMHSQRSLEAEVRQSAVYIDRTAAGALLVTSPAGHIGGLSSSLRPFLSGENTIFLDR